MQKRTWTVQLCPYPVMIDIDVLRDASILIVDDQQANVQFLEEMLLEAGYQNFFSTMDPKTVCALYRANRYDLILLDLHMPSLDGFQVMEGLKEIETDGYLPVLVITVEPDQKLRALATGAKDFISKPFDLMEAKARIHNMLEVRLAFKQLKHYCRALESWAMHDALTGLPNRRLLMDRLSLAMAHARRNKSTMAVMYVDLDGFKEINDTLGHEAGDALLKMVADRLAAAVRQEDTVARMGGDEFVIGLWKLSHAQEVVKLASKVIHAVAQPYRIQDCNVNITASVGVGVYPQHGDAVETLMKSADMALNEAKRAGKNEYSLAVRADPMAKTNIDELTQGGPSPSTY